jgi:release factor glutamine methyltransferase
MTTLDKETRSFTIEDALRWGVVSLKGAGLDNPRLEAEVLLSRLLSFSRTRLLVFNDSPVPREAMLRFREWIALRCDGFPSAYITGEKEFHGNLFVVTKDVLIPRPETELLVDEVVRLASTSGLSAPMILDVGTGCGNIAVTLASLMRGAALFAVDISAGALDVAKENAKRLGVEDRIVFLQGDLFEPVTDLDVTFDCIVSNPPYVGTDEIHAMDPCVAAFEPPIALFAGRDGLDMIRKIVESAPLFLKPGGILSLEIGYRQAVKVKRLMESRGFSKVTTVRDLDRHCRTITGTRE